jgi:hypothetical protein
MNQDECVRVSKIAPEKAVELLFNDSSKNVSDLKSRQWNAANYGVLAIVAIAVFARENTVYRSIAPWLMFLVVACHLGVTFRCRTNLKKFRVRIKTLISCYFPEESHELFEKGRLGWEQAGKLEFPRGKKGQDFEDAVVDEGLIEGMLFLTTPVTFLFAYYIVRC